MMKLQTRFWTQTSSPACSSAQVLVLLPAVGQPPELCRALLPLEAPPVAHRVLPLVLELDLVLLDPGLEWDLVLVLERMEPLVPGPPKPRPPPLNLCPCPGPSTHLPLASNPEPQATRIGAKDPGPDRSNQNRLLQIQDHRLRPHQLRVRTFSRHCWSPRFSWVLK